MSKQSKKQRKRRERQKKQRRRKLINLFDSLYPNAPPGTAEQVVIYALSLGHSLDFPLSQTALMKEAVLEYVRAELTDYGQRLDSYFEAVLGSLADGKPYTGQLPDTLTQESDQEAFNIISAWE